MSSSATFPSEPRPSLLDRALSVASTVRPGEGLTAILLAANVFVLLGAYYILKTVREPLILNSPGGAEVKSYASAGQALLFLIVVPLYGALASRVNRMRLIAFVTLFFISNLAIFYAFGTAGANIGVPYFLWVGIFNMLIVAQFWAFANDIYTEEEGKRLFPIVGVGASLGALVGSYLTAAVTGTLGPFQLMLVCAVLLGLTLLLTFAVDRRESTRTRNSKTPQEKEPLEKTGGFQLILQNRYLLLIAILVLLLNWVNTLGEYMLGRFVSETALSLPEADRGAFTQGYYGNYYTWVNLIGFLMQAFLVSRIFKWIGVRGALFILPCIALGGYGILAIAPMVAVVRVAKILENSTDYSLNNTVRHALYLPTSREAKYKAKAATDTFFVRTGDMLQAAVVFLGVHLAFTVHDFALVNIVLVAAWLIVAVLIYRRHKKLTAIS